MPSNKKVYYFVFFALPAFAAALNQTHFSYFKNTPFGPCDPSKFPTNNASLLYSDLPSTRFTFTTRSLTPVEFCNSFWNHTIIPTLPNGAAFGYTWLSCFINCISFLVSMALLYYTAALQPKPASECHPLLSPDDDASSVRSKQAVLTPDPFLEKVFWTNLTCDCVKTVLWWTAFIQFARSSSTYGPISLIQWISPYAYRVTFANSAVAYAAILMAKTPLLPVDGNVTFTAVTYELTRDPFYSLSGISSPCSRTDAARAVLRTDPAAPVRQLVYFIGALISVLFFLPSVILELHGKITRRSMLIFQIYAIGAVQGTMSLVMKLVQWRSTPLSWDNTCPVVHIMMSPDSGYWDVEFVQLWRILKAWLNV